MDSSSNQNLPRSSLAKELPPVDLFVTTADPELEPPIIPVNTVLSLLALDYPTHKLACYVSDDGCSPHTFYALQEASKFAKFWVPFCKKYDVQVRAPLRYFSDKPAVSMANETSEFKQEWLQMKEKRPKQSHHFKAGAMNVLTRVSGLITNAPFMLNVDCDMIVNNPKVVLHALCILLDSKGEKEVAFAQFPQQFYATLKDDPFGNQMAIFIKYLTAGMAGLQGPFYSGTNCLNRRKVIYGLSPDSMENGNSLSEEELEQKFGDSKEIVKTVAHAFEGKTYLPSDVNISIVVDIATQVASCGYEHGTGWGKQVGWIYGSITEDKLLGLTIHEKGWRSELCTPNPIAFTGIAPGGGPTAMAQQKRWAIGLLEIFFSKHCPLFGTMFHKLTLRQCLAYMWIINYWGLKSIFEVSYACLLSHCIITNSNFLPKDLGMCIAIAFFTVYKIYTISEYLAAGLSFRAWWNNQRMSRIASMNAGFCAFICILLKMLRISDTIFDITKKDVPLTDDVRDDKDAGRFTFDESLVFLPGTTILLLQLSILFMKLLRLHPLSECGVVEIFCSIYLVICYWPFFRGLFEKGKYRIPFSLIYKSIILTCFFVHLCKGTIDG
ncbi:unnamed protein product [Sphenostylis stenocarpa]|uniref:Cellulose synthase-like protein H1 n=1 Tax=Sphenostylis stenocarpa TaxID=92480 RepID=A0AA87BD68_9FABA|nr:unnamed protein product [Sphenostylis stenocarpa]